MILSIIILILAIIILLLILLLSKTLKSALILSSKEKDFIKFAFDIFIDYGDTLGIQSEDQRKLITAELEKIKTKLDKQQ